MSNPPIAELGAGGAPTDVDRAVAKLIVEEIPNGACLQLGIGGMPNTVGSMIAESDLKDLGVHTEMYVDAFVDIAMAGKINGLKQGDRSGHVRCMPSALAPKSSMTISTTIRNATRLPYRYTNDARTIAQIDNFISINNAVDIDLFGQVNARNGRHQADLRRGRPAGLCAGRVPVQGRQELYLLFVHIQGRRTADRIPASARRWRTVRS